LYRDGVVIGPTSLREFGQDDNIATDRNIEIIPNLTWVDIPVPGQHTYEIRASLTGSFNLVSGVAGRSLNALICK